MQYLIHTLGLKEFPSLLREIPEVPKTLNYRGRLPEQGMRLLAVVGSRAYSNYGKQVVQYLISGLQGYNIGIVSGLALGIDSLAHQSALQNNLYTLAIPGSGIAENVIYPYRHRPLARNILDAGGGLLSEFDPHFTATKWSFTQRNRIMAGISHATLVIEATEKSGTLITARMTTDYNRELLVVPGDIFSGNSAGPHQFLKLGATPVTHPHDILHALGINPETKEPLQINTLDLTDIEKKVLKSLRSDSDTDSIIRETQLQTQEINSILIQLELQGLLISENGTYKVVH